MDASKGSLDLFSTSELVSPLYVARLDHEQRYLFVNEAYAKRYKLLPSQLIGKRTFEVVGTAAQAVIEPYIARALAGESVDVQIAIPYQRLGVRQAHVSMHPETDSAGAVRGCVVILSDITERRTADEALYKKEREFKTLVENAPDVIARLDRELRNTYINRAVQDAFGLRPADIIGKTLEDSGYPPYVASAYREAAQAVFGTGVEHAFSFHMNLKGAVRHFTARVLPEFDRLGHAESVMVITYDVTQRTQAQLERDALLIREQAARSQAEAATRARDQFLSIVSHELRSPLNGIQSWTHVLENYLPSEPAALRRAIGGIKTGVQQQVRLIDDLLDATLVLSGKLRVNRAPLRLGQPIENAIASLTEEAQQKGVTLVAELDDSVSNAVIEADPKRLEQVIWNLVSNAIKFTSSEGVITVSASLTEHHGAIHVIDNGRGIAPSLLPRLFDPFHLGDGSNTRRAGGVGLGLTLVKRLTELHGGQVEVHSEGEGKGSEFIVRIPRISGVQEMTSATVRSEPPRALGSLQHCRICLVDDQLESRDSLAQLLHQAGAEVTAFESGIAAEAVLCKDGMPSSRFDLMISDIAMPEQDGYTTMEHVRQYERQSGVPADRTLPAIALTAFRERDDQLHALASGFQMHLGKPVDPTELVSIIDQLARRQALPAENA